MVANNRDGNRGHLNQEGGSERKECLQIESGRDSHGWEEKLI